MTTPRMKFDYVTTKVRDIKANATRHDTGKITVESLEIEGRKLRPSTRFWSSFFANYGISNSIFKFYDHDEVFLRISERIGDADATRICIESNPDSPDDIKERALSISNPAKILVDHDELIGLLGRYGIDTSNADYGIKSWPTSGGTIDPDGIRIGQVGGNQVTPTGAVAPVPAIPDLTYDTGIVRSLHTPNNVGSFQIAGDTFHNRFVMDTPIDGYGKPAIYLMLLRQICTNGSIGYSRVFRADISLGKGEDSFEYALVRAMEGYNNEDGFQALRERYEMAAKSWASINEVNVAYKALVRLHHAGQVKVAEKFLTDKIGEDGEAMTTASPIIRSFHNLVGDLSRHYGLANLDALGAKRQRTLPAGTTMYELMNFMSEVATHRTMPAGSRAAQAVIGSYLAEPYDLEGTFEKFKDWSAFLLEDATAQDSFAHAQAL